jgi:hypothetical protein
VFLFCHFLWGFEPCQLCHHKIPSWFWRGLVNPLLNMVYRHIEVSCQWLISGICQFSPIVNMTVLHESSDEDNSSNINLLDCVGGGTCSMWW